MKLNEKIIKLRKENGLSQEEFGNKINVSRQAISKWENEEAKPDTDKIQEIVKKFNVSYEYLLNDEVETMQENTKEPEKRKSKKRTILKVIITIFAIYLLVSIYKFIAFYRFYLVANSFSENNYSMVKDMNIKSYKTENNALIYYSTAKVGNKILEKTYSAENSNELREKFEKEIPNTIIYTDIDKKETYELNYDEDQEKYIYTDRKQTIQEDELEEVFKDRNLVKEDTLSEIPTGLKQIFLDSINPVYYYVDIVRGEIRWYSIIERAEKIVKLSKDGLVERVNLSTKYGDSIDVIYSYNYVQNNLKEVGNPLEDYKDKIIFEK